MEFADIIQQTLFGWISSRANIRSIVQALQGFRSLGRRLAVSSPRPQNHIVIFITGAPGVGKGTNCAALVSGFTNTPTPITHVSYGDLVRKLAAMPGSDVSLLPCRPNSTSRAVPDALATRILREHIDAAVRSYAQQETATSSILLVDGFPRTPGQLHAWFREAPAACAAVFLVCSKEACLQRVGIRGASDPRRPDDAVPERNKERVERFLGNLEPLKKALRGKGLPIVEIDAEREIGLVIAETKGVVKTLFAQWQAAK